VSQHVPFGPSLLLVLVAVAPAAAADDQRLGRDVVPTFEEVRLVVDAGKPDYTGSVHVELRVIRPARSLRFHAEGPAIERLVLKGRGGAPGTEARSGAPIATEHRVGERGLVTVTAAGPLPPGDYGLDIDFSNAFDTQAVGLYRTEAGGRAYAFTQFEAADARKAFPCWDEPGFKIPYRLTLVVPADHLAISNTAAERESVADGLRTVVFRRTRPLPSYLLAIATGPLETVPVPGTSVPTRIVTVAGQSGLAGEAARLTPPALKALETWFGARYPFDKLDIIAVPEFWSGAMENAGAVTFADDLLLIDPKAVTFGDRRALAQTLTHELAHMWFGDMVTMAWWDDLWLNESFASWLGDKMADRIDPAFGSDLGQARNAHGAMLSDSRLSTRAIRQTVGALDNFDQLADELAYDKGQAVLGMFEAWAGPEVFRKGVLAYLDAHRWGNARAVDLWVALSRAAGRDVGAPLASFVDQEGVPLITAEILPGGRVRLSQERFLHAGVRAPRTTTWRIPVTLKYPDGQAVRTRRLLLTRTTEVVALGGGRTPAWVHPNGGERGYYRWLVPPPPLLALARAAPRVLDARERVGYVGNLTALLGGGRIHGDDFLRALGPLADDPRPEVVSAVMEALGAVRQLFIEEAGAPGTAGGATPGLRAPFAAFVRTTLDPALRRFGLTPAPGEPEAVSLLRPQLLAWLADAGADAKARELAEAMARRYVEEPDSIDPSLADTVVWLSALHGDRALFRLYRERFEAAEIPSERGLYLGALGGFRDEAIAERALRFVLDESLRPPEVVSLLLDVGGTDGLRDRRLDWAIENYAALRRRIPDSAAVILAHLAAGCSEPRLRRASEFFSDPANAVPGMDRELAKVAESVTDCTALRAREADGVARYLVESCGEECAAPGP
jgi:alanyl aminopeptidase